MSFALIKRALIVTALVGAACPDSVRAATITQIVDWDEDTNAGGTTYTEFTELATWTHDPTFDPLAASFTSATLELSFAGTRSTTQELWWLFDSGEIVMLGTITSTGNNSYATFVQQQFSIPSSLFPAAFPVGSWTLLLRLEDQGSQTNSIALDYSKLTVVYEPVPRDPDPPVPPAPVPEPGSLLLLGSGLVAAAAGLRRRVRS